MTQCDKLTTGRFLEHAVWCWNEDETYHLPVTDHEPLPEDLGTLFVRAKFKLPGGCQLDGYIFGLHSILGLGIFIGDREVVFNANLPDFAVDDERLVCGLLDIETGNLFPIRYETKFHYKDEMNLCGEFGFS